MLPLLVFFLTLSSALMVTALIHYSSTTFPPRPRRQSRFHDKFQKYLVTLALGLSSFLIALSYYLLGCDFRVQGNEWARCFIGPFVIVFYHGFYFLSIYFGGLVNNIIAPGGAFLRGGGEIRAYILKVFFHIMWEEVIHSGKSNHTVVILLCTVLISLLSFLALFAPWEDLFAFAKMVKHHLGLTIGQFIFFGFYMQAIFCVIPWFLTTEILKGGGVFPCGVFPFGAELGGNGATPGGVVGDLGLGGNVALKMLEEGGKLKEDEEGQVSKKD